MIRVVHPGSRIWILTFYPSRIPDPGVKKAPDPESRVRNTVFFILWGSNSEPPPWRGDWGEGWWNGTVTEHADANTTCPYYSSILFGLNTRLNVRTLTAIFDRTVSRDCLTWVSVYELCIIKYLALLGTCHTYTVQYMRWDVPTVIESVIKFF